MFLPLSLAEELGRFIGLLILKRRSLILTLPPGELLIELGLNLRLFLFKSLHYHLSRCKWILSVRSSKLFPVGFFLSLSSHLLGGRIRTLILTHAFQFFSSLSFCFSLQGHLPCSVWVLSVWSSKLCDMRLYYFLPGRIDVRKMDVGTHSSIYLCIISAVISTRLLLSFHGHLSRSVRILPVWSSKLFPMGFFLSLSSHLLGGHIRTLILTHAFLLLLSLSFCFSFHSHLSRSVRILPVWSAEFFRPLR